MTVNPSRAVCVCMCVCLVMECPPVPLRPGVTPHPDRTGALRLAQVPSGPKGAVDGRPSIRVGQGVYVCVCLCVCVTVRDCA
jgi:hypothetical protein